MKKIDMEDRKIKGWVAREGKIKGYKHVYSDAVGFFHRKPERNEEDQEWDGILGMYIPESFFPDLKWEDEPIEVEITITPIK